MNEWLQGLKGTLQEWQERLPDYGAYTEEVQQTLSRVQAELNQPVRINILGGFNAGKSTMLNTLLGEEVMITKATAATAVTTVIQYGAVKKRVAILDDGQEVSLDDASFSTLSAENDSYTQRMDEERHGIHYIRLELPNELLKNMTLVDTPGYDNSPVHNAMTDRHIGHCDCALWVFPYRLSGNQTEKHKLQHLKELGVPVYGILNRIDEHDEEEESIDSYVDYLQREFQDELESLTPISAKFACEAQVDGDRLWREVGNWSALDVLLDDILAKSYGEQRVRQKLSDLVQLFKGIMQQAIRENAVLQTESAMDRLVRTIIPSSLETCQTLTEKRHRLNHYVACTEQLYDLSIDSPQDIAVHQRLLNELREYAPIWFSFEVDWEACNQAVHASDILTKRINRATATRTSLQQKFDGLSSRRQSTKKDFSQLAADQHAFNNELRNLQLALPPFYKKLAVLKKSLVSYGDEVTNQIRSICLQTRFENSKIEPEWRSFLSNLQEEFYKIDKEQSEHCLKIQEIIESYQETVGSFLSHLQSEQNTRDLLITNDQLMHFALSLPFEPYNEIGVWLEESPQLPERYDGNQFGRVISEPILALYLPSVPDTIDLPIDQQLVRLRERNRRRIKLIMAASVAAFVFWKKDDILRETTEITKQIGVIAENVFSYADTKVEKSNSSEEELLVGYDDDAYAAEDYMKSENRTAASSSPGDGASDATFSKVDEETARNLSNFIQEFRVKYEYAVNQGDFTYVSEFLATNGVAYQEIQYYITDIRGKGTFFDFETTDVTEVGVLNGQSYYVDTDEVFLFTGAEGDKWRYYKTKRYLIQPDENNHAKITELYNLKGEKERVYE